jgi:hypothetical protein
MTRALARLSAIKPLAQDGPRGWRFSHTNPSQWTVIFYANQDRLGDNVSMLVRIDSWIGADGRRRVRVGE